MGLVTALAAGALVGGSLLSSKSANKNAARVQETSQNNTDANNALARDIYGQNKQILSPFVQRGNVAGNQINALLGLGGGPQNNMGSAQITPNALSQFEGQYSGNAGSPYGLGDNGGMNFGAGNNMGSAYLQANPDVAAEFGRVGAQFGNDPNAFAQFHYNTYGMNEGRAMPGATMGAQQQTPQSAQDAANAGFDIFKNSTGYKFRLGEGLDAVGSAYAGIGGLQSGAAMRGINEYGQNFASNEFGNYLNALGGQQAVGAGAGSALAGVGQNFAGTVIGNNNNNAQNQMQAQLGRQNGFANALGTLGGAGFGFMTGGR
ncbi:hypothetical protein UFOVP368_16 [uncultured Caudovirales phage]|uniref:DNA transfer protein n=1 Tax=uncultured Caudovirales phage TaxID=2100421 RepID=A0A6J7WWV6_9CAUD|nr:hypothetical protein UFOVP368_16 [uncultured Caudovirales phage]